MAEYLIKDFDTDNLIATVIKCKKFYTDIKMKDILKETQLLLTEPDVTDKSFYRYPNISLGRDKIQLLKDNHNISITRKINNADYKIISAKSLNSLYKGYYCCMKNEYVSRVHFIDENNTQVDVDLEDRVWITNEDRCKYNIKHFFYIYMGCKKNYCST